MTDSPQEIASDIAAVARIGAVPALLKLICQQTGMGFAAVARVTEGSWTACAVQDNIQFGLQAGGALPVHSTLCIEARAAREPIVFDHASQNPLYCNHHTPRTYNIESYISVPIVRPNGEYFGNLCAIDPQPHVVSDTRTVAMFTAFADLIAVQLDTEERQQVTETALASERETGELREQFIAVLGHDLRAPLNSIAAAAELLSRRTGDAEVSRLGNRLKTSTRRMSALINDVLDFARGRLGSGMGITREALPDLDRSLRDVLGEFRNTHAERQITQAIDVGTTVHGDRDRIQQLLSNLLGNALTHGSPTEPVVVEASVLGKELVLTVSNQGEPIDPEHLPHLFKPYWRPAHSRPGGGLGLGLYICAEIVKAHGGELQVNSTAEEGTFFIARLPVAPDQAGRASG